MGKGYVQFTSGTGKTHTRRDEVDYEKILAAELAAAEKGAAEYAAGANQLNETYKAGLDAAYEADVKGQEQQAAAEVKKAKASYDSLFDVNRAQQLAGERNLRRQMAGIGMEKSGWNATNQMALASTRAGADAGARTARQQAVDAILQNLAAYKAQAQLQKTKDATTADYETGQGILQNRQNAQQAARQWADSRYANEWNRQEAENAWRDQWERQDYADSQAEKQYADAMKQQAWENNLTGRELAATVPTETGPAGGVGGVTAEELSRVRGYMDQYYDAAAKGSKNAAVYKERALNEVYRMETRGYLATREELAAALWAAGITEDDYEAYRDRIEPAPPVIDRHNIRYETTK